jgi:hypothetical protein
MDIVTRSRLVTVSRASKGYTCLDPLRIPRASRNRTVAMLSLTSGSGPVESLAECARSARQVSQSPNVATEWAPLLVGWDVLKWAVKCRVLKLVTK